MSGYDFINCVQNIYDLCIVGKHSQILQSLLSLLLQPTFVYNLFIYNLKVAVPAYRTHYFCQLYRAPKLNTKHHIIKVTSFNV